MSVLKKSLLGKTECFYKNNEKELENQVCQLRTQSCWHQSVQDLTNFLELKH